MASRNYYAVLGVRSTDSEEVIKRAYRKLAKENHPDLHPGDAAAENRFKEIGEAWETLGDKEKRKKYDEGLAGAQTSNPYNVKSTAQARPTRSRNMSQEDYNNLMRGFDSFFSDDNIKHTADGMKPGAKPIDTASMFERYMGFKGPQKKK